MLTIRKHIGVMALVLGFGAVAVAPGLAQAKTTRNYTATLQSAPLATGNGYPAPGGTALLAGSVQARPFGNGALIDRVTITSQPAPNVFAFEGTERVFFGAGTQRNRFTGTATVQADGSQVVAVSGRYTGGTGRYRGASGRYTFSGTVAPGSTVLIGSSRGRVSYR
jgi:hypothetical protein